MNKITYEERKAVYEKAIQTWGARAQVMMAIEEMSELTKELCKHFRGNPNADNIADEIADVTIMLEQLRLIYGLNDEVCSHMDAKITRLQGRLLCMEPPVSVPYQKSGDERLLEDLLRENHIADVGRKVGVGNV